MILRLTNDFATYELEDPVFVQSALHGPCLRARFQMIGHRRWDEGDFRLDRAIVEMPLRRHNGSARAWCKVDPDTLIWAGKHRWCYDNGYVVRKVRDGNGEWRRRTLSQEIMRLAAGDQREVDHINGDRLDNRRENLRVGTKAQNQQNRRGANRDGRSRFRREHMPFSQEAKDFEWPEFESSWHPYRPFDHQGIV